MVSAIGFIGRSCLWLVGAASADGIGREKVDRERRGHEAQRIAGAIPTPDSARLEQRNGWGGLGIRPNF